MGWNHEKKNPSIPNHALAQGLESLTLHLSHTVHLKVKANYIEYTKQYTSLYYDIAQLPPKKDRNNAQTLTWARNSVFNY